VLSSERGLYGIEGGVDLPRSEVKGGGQPFENGPFDVAHAARNVSQQTRHAKDLPAVLGFGNCERDGADTRIEAVFAQMVAHIGKEAAYLTLVHGAAARLGDDLSERLALRVVENAVGRPHGSFRPRATFSSKRASATDMVLSPLASEAAA
jgi:hypothetical protein